MNICWGTWASYPNDTANVTSAVKKWSASLFLQNFFCKVIVKNFVFFWRNNEALGHVTSIIILLMLFLQRKNPVRHYFFRKMMRHLIISSEKMKCFIIFLEKMKCLAFFSEEIKRHFIVFWRDNEVLHFFTAEITFTGFLM